jgi:hypothetical protein
MVTGPFSLFLFVIVLNFLGADVRHSSLSGGRNMGRAGVIVHKERHLGGFDIVRSLPLFPRSSSFPLLLYSSSPCMRVIELTSLA